MANCCDDPTEPGKLDPRELLREQEHYGNLLRDLFTGDPEKLMLKELRTANTYIRELAALRAHYESVREHAIAMLGQESLKVLQRIADNESDVVAAQLAQKRIAELNG